MINRRSSSGNTRISQQEKKNQLLDEINVWMSKEDEGREEDKSSWLQEGIALYKQMARVEPEEPKHVMVLADLYLQWGKDEKIRSGNRLSAYDALKKATRKAYDRPEAFYRLSFLLAEDMRKWEEVLFYAKEALEKGLPGDLKIKLLCNMALAYDALRYREAAKTCMNEAIRLDVQKKNSAFIELYQDKRKAVHVPGSYLSKEAGIDHTRQLIQRNEKYKLVDEAEEGRCLLLDLTTRTQTLCGYKDTIELEPKEAAVLAFLMENAEKPFNREQIEAEIWHGEPVAETTVKRYISSIRRKLVRVEHVAPEEVKASMLATKGPAYIWICKKKAYVLR